MDTLSAVVGLVLSACIASSAPAVVPAAPSATLMLPAQALVTDDDVRVRSGPSAIGTDVNGYVHRNQLVKVEERKADWFRITHDFGEGWVFGRYLQFDLPVPIFQ